jgi:uncharacterized DUF497 family protein
MRIVWNEAKRRSNLRKHGLDFVDAGELFSGFTYTVEDNRFAYQERRFITLGLLSDMVVTIVHTETDDEIRIISMRKATRYEQEIWFRSI